MCSSDLEALFSLAPGDWAGPHRSDFGAHLVRLRNRTEARLPAYDEIAAQVAERFGAERRREANEAAYARMRSKYDVVVDAPATGSAP